MSCRQFCGLFEIPQHELYTSPCDSVLARITSALAFSFRTSTYSPVELTAIRYNRTKSTKQDLPQFIVGKLSGELTMAVRVLGEGQRL